MVVLFGTDRRRHQAHVPNPLRRFSVSRFPVTRSKRHFEVKADSLLTTLARTSSSASGVDTKQYHRQLPLVVRQAFTSAVHRLNAARFRDWVSLRHIGILEEAADVTGNVAKAMVVASKIQDETRLKAFASRVSFLFHRRINEHRFTEIKKRAHHFVTEAEVDRFAALYKPVEESAAGATHLDPLAHRKMLRTVLAANYVYYAVCANRPANFPHPEAKYTEADNLALRRQFTEGELVELQENLGLVKPANKPQALPVGTPVNQLVEQAAALKRTLLRDIWPEATKIDASPDAFRAVVEPVLGMAREALGASKVQACDLLALSADKLMGRAEWFYHHPGDTYKIGKGKIKPAESVIEGERLQSIHRRDTQPQFSTLA